MKTHDDLNSVHEAVMRHSLAQLRQAISSGGDIDFLDREGRTALFYAVRDGDDDIVDELIKAGSDINISDGRGETPLHFAARFYKVNAAERLIAGGAIVDVVDANGNTPLWRAVFDCKDRGEVITLLIRAGADKYRKNNHGISPQELAEKIANYDARQFL